MDELKKRDWELVAHSRVENDLLVNFTGDREAERDYIRATLSEYEEVVGKKAKGWLSPSVSPTMNTLGILVEEGMEFFCDFVNDDQPYPIQVGDRQILSIPYTTEINDYPLFIWFRNVAKTEILVVSINKNLENGLPRMRKLSEVFRTGLLELM